MRKWLIRIYGKAGFTALLALLLASLPASAAPQRRFGLGSWSGTLEGVGQTSRQSSQPGNGDRSIFKRAETKEQISLRNSGFYILDPRLLTVSAGGTFALSQETSSADGVTASRDGTLQGFDIFSSFLRARAVSLNMFANQNESSITRELSGESDILTKTWGGSLFIRKLKIPSTISFQQETRKEDSRVSGIVSRLEENRKIATYEGQRRWDDSKVDLRYQYIDLADVVFPRLSFRNHTGSFDYGLDFGPENNWHWDSRIRGFSRSGAAALTNWNIDESLRIDHSEAYRTEYDYTFASTKTSAGTNTMNRGAVSLRHKLFESLVSNFGLDLSLQSPPEGRNDTYSGRGGVIYTKRLPGDGRLNMDLQGTIQRQESAVRNTTSSVIQETHTAASPFVFPIPLKNPFVVISSIVVTKIAVGPLPAGCLPSSGPPTPLVLGQDFVLEKPVDDIIEIVPIACSGTIAGINPGDTIAVDYQFTVSGSFSLLSTSWRAAANLDYTWVRPYFSHDQTDQRLISGRDRQFLDNRRLTTTGIEFRFGDQSTRMRFIMETQKFKSERQAFDVFRTSQFLRLAILPRTTITLNANQASFVFSQPRRQRRKTSEGRLALTINLSGALFADAFVSIRRLNDTLVPNERTKTAGLKLRWFIRKMEISPTVNFTERRLGNSKSNEFQGMLRIIRRF